MGVDPKRGLSGPGGMELGDRAGGGSGVWESGGECESPGVVGRASEAGTSELAPAELDGRDARRLGGGGGPLRRLSGWSSGSLGG